MGDTYAMLDLARFYEQGKYVERDAGLSIHLYHLAAENNCVQALIYLGEASRYDGKFESAVQYYKRATSAAVLVGEYTSFAYLAECYVKGQGVEKDISKAAELLLHLVDKGNLSRHPRLGSPASFFWELIQDYPREVATGLTPEIVKGNSSAASILRRNGGEIGLDVVSTVEKYVAIQKLRQFANLSYPVPDYFDNDRTQLPSITYINEEHVINKVVYELKEDMFLELMEYLV